MIKQSWVIPPLIFLLYLAIGMLWLYRGHPYEDAYILFKYIENLASGKGIVYYAGGPRAEGFVDFLWVLLSSGLVRFKIDAAVAAVLLNALGAALVSWIFVRSARESQVRHHGTLLFLTLFSFFILFSPAALAGYGGFSTLFYAAAILVAYALSLEDSPRAILSIPVVSVFIALIRADGVIVGAGFCLAGILHARRQKIAKPYLWLCLTAALVGAVYFVRRYGYFGMLLPLPLYVKSGHSLVHGLASNWQWLTNPSASPLPVLIVLLFLWGKALPKAEESPSRLFFSFLPLVMLIAALCFAKQLQNIHWRFQSPFTLVLIYMMFRMAIVVLESRAMPRVTVALLMIASLLPSARYSAGVIKNALMYTPSYLDTFAPLLAQRLGPDSTIAITEAGRLAYWHRGRVEDMHGLNTAHTALFPPNPRYLRKINPDLVMYQHGGTLITDVFRPGSKQFIVPLESERLEMAVKVPYRELFKNGTEDYRDLQIERTEAVPVLLTKFVIEADYEIYATRYASHHRQPDYWHIYAFKRGLPAKDEILADLDKTQQGFYKSYAQLKHFWGTKN